MAEPGRHEWRVTLVISAGTSNQKDLRNSILRAVMELETVKDVIELTLEKAEGTESGE